MGCRQLAKGYALYVGGPGEGASPWGIWKYADAPAECFADAKPEEPLIEERTLRSPDGAFVMTVWLKDDPLRIEARIEQQPEEWRQHSCGAKMLIHAPGISVSSWAYPSFCVGALRLRGHQRHQDNEVFPFWFGCHIDRDAYLAKLEATVAAMPRLADQFRVEDRVVVAGDVRPDGWDADVEGRPGFVGQRGIITRFSSQNSWAAVKVDSRAIARLVCLINLRHERADERPAGVTISGDEAVAVMNPDPRRANFPPTRYGANGLPIFEPKHEPPPSRKYEDGQCVMTLSGRPRIISGADYFVGDREWSYSLENLDYNIRESYLKPCPPPLSEAQRRLLPGDKVRVREKRWDARGMPKDVRDDYSDFVWILRASWQDASLVRCHIERESPKREVVEQWLHNLEPAEEK